MNVKGNLFKSKIKQRGEFFSILDNSGAVILKNPFPKGLTVFHSSRPQRWRQVNQSQFIDGETSFAFSNASSVL